MSAGATEATNSGGAATPTYLRTSDLQTNKQVFVKAVVTPAFVTLIIRMFNSRNREHEQQ